MVKYEDLKDPEIGRGERIKDAMNASGLKKSFIAEKLGVSNTTINKWQKTGQIKPFMAMKLCQLIGADLMYIFFNQSLSSIREPDQQYIQNTRDQEVISNLSKLPEPERDFFEELIRSKAPK